jgi:hypothetical protein
VSDKRSRAVLPSSLEQVRRKLRGSDDGDRQMVAILAAVLEDGLPAVEVACGEALSQGVHSASVIPILGEKGRVTNCASRKTWTYAKVDCN